MIDLEFRHVGYQRIGDIIRLVPKKTTRKVFAYVAKKGGSIKINAELFKAVYVNNKKVWSND